MATKKKVKVIEASKGVRQALSAVKRRRGPINPKTFLKWLDDSGACYLGLAECKARLYRYRNSPQPVEITLVEAIGQAARWWPDLTNSGCTSAPFLPAYLRWLSRKVSGVDPTSWNGVSTVLTRARVRRAMKRDGFIG